MLFLPYEATCNELMNFNFNSLHNVRTKPGLLLLDWLGVRSDVQTMHGYLWIKSGHVSVAPCKDIYILLYKYHQLFSFCEWQAFTYKDGPRVILTTQVNLDHLIFSRWFALFGSLFPLEIWLLSRWFLISSFYWLQLAAWSWFVTYIAFMLSLYHTCMLINDINKCLFSLLNVGPNARRNKRRTSPKAHFILN